MIDTVIFDLEGVIIDTEGLWDNANRLFLQAHGAVYDRVAIKPLLTGRSLAAGVEIMRGAYGLSGELQLLVDQRKAIIEEQLLLGSSFLPGFSRFYESIRSSHKSCVASSMDRQLLAIVDRQLGLTAMFGGHLYSIADVGYISKPDPAIFLYAAQRVGASPEECVVIEDSPQGVRAARNAGMRCIGLASTFDASLLSAADRVVRFFSEIDLSKL